MLRAALFLSVVAIVFGVPIDLGDFPPQPGCHYNISGQANFHLANVHFHWYYDSVTSPQPLTTFTCLDYRGNFSVVNGNVGKTSFVEKVVVSGHKTRLACHGPNYADANADFDTTCMIRQNKFNIQLRIAETDYKTYALVTYCGNAGGHYVELMGIMGPNKSGIDPAVRQRLIKRLVAAGWNPNYIQRVPSQKDC